eukprot:1143360-Pelagomonas_calceolata.AAC.4
MEEGRGSAASSPKRSCAVLQARLSGWPVAALARLLLLPCPVLPKLLLPGPTVSSCPVLL